MIGPVDIRLEVCACSDAVHYANAVWDVLIFNLVPAQATLAELPWRRHHSYETRSTISMPTSKTVWVMSV
jgi:hypothetical protein